VLKCQNAGVEMSGFGLIIDRDNIQPYICRMGKRKLKIALGLFLGFILLLVTLPFLFKGKIVSKIKEEANKHLNARLDFDNDIGLNLIKNFPNISISVDNLSIIGKGDFEGDTLIYSKSTRVVVDLKTLWNTKEIPIRKFYADEPYINIIYHKDGKANYDITLPDTSADTSSSKVKIKFDVYELKNGRISYNDEGLGFYTYLNGVNHVGSGNFDDMVFDLKTETDAKELTLGYGGVNYLDHVKTHADAVLHMDLNNYRFEFKDNMISFNDLPLSVNGFVALPNDSDIDMDLDIKNNKSDMKKLLSLLPALYRNKFEELEAGGSFQFEGILKGTYNDTRMPGYGLHLEVRDGGLKYPSMPDKISDINLGLHISNEDGITDHTIIDLKNLHAMVGSDMIDARVYVTNPVSNALIDAESKGKLNLGTLTRIIPMTDTKLAGILDIAARVKGNAGQLTAGEYEKLDASGNLVATGVVYESAGSMPIKVEKAAAQLSPTKITLSECKATINSSDIDAKGSLENFFGYMLRSEKIKGAITLNSENFNCNEFMSEEGGSSKESDTSKLKPIKVPENIDFVLNSKINKLTYDNYNITNFIGNVKVNNGILSFEKTTLEMLGAKFQLDGSYNSLDIKKPLFDLAFTIQQLDIQKAFNTFVSVKALAPVAQYMNGMINTTLHYKSSLDENFMPVLSSIDSKGNLDILQAKLSGFKPLDLMADKLQLANLKNFDLQRILLSFLVNEGQVVLKPFKTKWNNYTMELLEGTTGLDKNMNFHLKLSVPRNEFGSANTALNNLVQQANAKSPVPVKLGDMVDVDVFLTGSMLKPEISTNLRDMANKALDDAKDALIRKAQDSLNNLKAEGEAKAKAEALKYVADVQKQADKIKADAAAAANKAREQGYKAADSLVNSVKNPLGKVAAKAAADKMKKDADAKAQQIVNEANARADAMVLEARRKVGIN
jgi:hypothetical protein